MIFNAIPVEFEHHTAQGYQPLVPEMLHTNSDSFYVSDESIQTNEGLEQSFGIPSDHKSNKDSFALSDPNEWDSKLEARFLRLVEKKALGHLSLNALIEFERLSEQRRRLKNPRTGEEIIAEYEQRMVTRNLVKALAQYVKFHKPTHHTKS